MHTHIPLMLLAKRKYKEGERENRNRKNDIDCLRVYLRTYVTLYTCLCWAPLMRPFFPAPMSPLHNDQPVKAVSKCPGHSRASHGINSCQGADPGAMRTFPGDLSLGPLETSLFPYL